MSIEPVRTRPAPRCYRRPNATTAVQGRAEIDGGAMLLTLSSFAAIAVFMLAYRGWVF